ncbi:MAG TPA: pitrilysin family protein [Candidatus Limnocylindrales bacterium]|nr:pitrilysin family protein [Candidatus Limnocylindrales bacterium]
MTSNAPERDGPVIAQRPTAGTPRSYEFPAVRRDRLTTGLTVLVVDMPGRPLVSASMILPVGAVDEPADEGGAAVLAARAMTEGTEHYDAVGLTEATERLGASLHAESGWDATSVSVDVPAARLEPALELLAEVLLRPTFPADEVERLRDERLNDLLQARADPRRRADEAYVATIYAPASPYHRPSGGTAETVGRLDPDILRRAHGRALDPARATLVIGGDLRGLDPMAIATRLFSDWTAPSVAAAARTPVIDSAASGGRIVRVVHRPGSVQTEIRIGHRGLPRQIPDFHAVSIMSAILGGLFNSRLNMQLREEKGYTYGAGAGFDMRRGAGPFTARAAVNTEVTVPAVLDTIAELERMRDEPVTEAELTAARDFLVGVFPLRFETAGAVVGALGGLAVHGLPLEELVDYRARIEAVGVDAVTAAARAHLDVDGASIVLVGDVDAFGADLEGASLGRLVIDRDRAAVEASQVAAETDEATTPGPADESDMEGPTAGAEDPDLPGSDEPTAADASAGHDAR